MKVLIIGGTGLISQGIVKHLLARGADITLYNRNKRENPFTAPSPGLAAPLVGAFPPVHSLTGDRLDFATFERTFSNQSFDVVIDMICFKPEEAESDLRAFAGRCAQFIFCSTVCTYGAKIPSQVLIDESFPQEPISDYGRNKLACEQLFLHAHEQKKLNATIIRPSHTYGPSGFMIDQLEANSVAWDRIEKNRPVVVAGDGLGLWQSTHRDDVGKLFAYAALNPKTFGQSYNATRDEITTWSDYYAQVSAALGKTPQLLFMPAHWIVAHDPKRFGLLSEITQFHGAYTSAKAKRDIPEFNTAKTPLTQGAADTFRDLRRRNQWRSGDDDKLYEEMARKAAALAT
jgi:nucleoside-diphosphate-sugar epimerase